MKRFKNILAVYGDWVGADDVISQAVALAKANQGRFTLIDVVPESRSTPIELKERQKRLERLKVMILTDGVSEVDIVVTTGRPFLAVIEQVLRSNHDLVIASAEGESSIARVYFGSLATHLMRKCPCPVWILKPEQSIGYKRVLACVDPKSSDDDKLDMNQTILELASSMAADNQAELHLVHAWEVEGPERDTINSECTDAAHAAVLQKHELMHREKTEKVAESSVVNGIEWHLHLPRDIPEHAIADLVTSLDIDLIVMGTVSRTGIPGLIIGNVAETLLSVVQCGVMTVKPDGFESPVVLGD